MQVANILSIDSSPLNGRVFDVCLDKGTYDAISLSPSNPEKRKAVYVQSSATLLKASGLLIIALRNIILIYHHIEGLCASCILKITWQDTPRCNLLIVM